MGFRLSKIVYQWVGLEDQQCDPPDDGDTPDRPRRRWQLGGLWGLLLARCHRIAAELSNRIIPQKVDQIGQEPRWDDFDELEVAVM
jgi:hypothetical protein